MVPAMPDLATDPAPQALPEPAPKPLTKSTATPAGWLHAQIDSLFVDHAILRFLYPALARLSDRMWRSNQPAPWMIRRFARMGVRTVVNLRGRRDCGSYVLERDACAAAGITLVDFPVNSRAAPKVETLVAAEALFRSIDYPAVMHCKSGADRVGLMSVFFQHVIEGRPMAEAQAQLTWRHLHIRAGKTGVLDHFYDSYVAANAASPVDFMTWVRTGYDPARVQAEFKAKRWGDLLVDGLLRRE